MKDPADTSEIDDLIAYIESPDYIRMTAEAQREDPKALLYGSGYQRVIPATPTLTPVPADSIWQDMARRAQDIQAAERRARENRARDRRLRGLLSTNDPTSVFKGFLEDLRPFRTRGALKAVRGADGAGRLTPEYSAWYEQDRELIDYTVYSYVTPIAWHVREINPQDPVNHWVFPETRYSQTTTGHQSTINLALAMMGVEVNY